MSNSQLTLYFFVQIAVILAVCQAVGWAARRAGQPQVVAEMVAGVLLGPSLLGLCWPAGFARLFPAETMHVLFPVAQLGLAAYMFVVGLEFRLDIVQRELRGAMAVSIAGIVAPFVLGAGLAWWLVGHTQLFPARTPLTVAMVFTGASMCITAFPVLARIIQFKKLTGTTMGAVSLGAGAINDAAAWCLLAIVLATIDGDFTHAAWSIGGGVGFVATAVWVIRPALAKWARRVEERGDLSDGGFAGCLVVVMLGASFTEAIGLHAVFGAFVMGAVIPRGVVTTRLIERVQPLTAGLLLPLFFTFSGLNTQLGLIDSPYLWAVAGAVLLVAIGGKFVACWLAARLTGMSQFEALGIGTLMNVRGLMELIIINIGLQRGIISPALFAVLVIMAVVTTLMASPMFDLFVGRRAAGAVE